MISLVKYNGNIKEEYENLFLDFPPEVIFPLETIEKAYKNNQYIIIHLYQTNNKIGYAHLVKTNKTIVLSFLSIKKDLRGQGLGHIFMSKLKDYFNEFANILVEMKEEPSRMKFYESLGYTRQKNIKYQIKSQEKNEYLDICLYMLNLNITHENIYSYEEIKEIIDLYYQVLFKDNFKEKYKLIKEL